MHEGSVTRGLSSKMVQLIRGLVAPGVRCTRIQLHGLSCTGDKLRMGSVALKPSEQLYEARLTWKSGIIICIDGNPRMTGCIKRRVSLTLSENPKSKLQTNSIGIRKVNMLSLVWTELRIDLQSV